MSDAATHVCPACTKPLVTVSEDIMRCESCKQDFAWQDMSWMMHENNPILDNMLDGEEAVRARHVGGVLLTAVVDTLKDTQKPFILNALSEEMLQKSFAPLDPLKVIYWLHQAGYLRVEVRPVTIPPSREQTRAALRLGKDKPQGVTTLIKELWPGEKILGHAKNEAAGMMPELPTLRAMRASNKDDYDA